MELLGQLGRVCWESLPPSPGPARAASVFLPEMQMEMHFSPSQDPCVLNAASRAEPGVRHSGSHLECATGETPASWTHLSVLEISVLSTCGGLIPINSPTATQPLSPLNSTENTLERLMFGINAGRALASYPHCQNRLSWGKLIYCQ